MAQQPRRDKVPGDVAALYAVMQRVEARLGGGEGVEGIYGSITATGALRVCCVYVCVVCVVFVCVYVSVCVCVVHSRGVWF